jgi:hypothetical protein
LQVPLLFLQNFSHVDDAQRRKYLAMVSWLDTAVGGVLDLLRERRMYEHSLVLFSSDNGGPIYYGGTSGAVRALGYNPPPSHPLCRPLCRCTYRRCTRRQTPRKKGCPLRLPGRWLG